MLRGPTNITLDAKGRLSIPTKYREWIAARCDGQVVCTVDHRKCVMIYPLPDWQEAQRTLMRLPNMAKKHQKMRELLMGYAIDVELDSHYRVLIPKEHRGFAGLDRQAMMFGQGNKFDVWDEVCWNERLSRWMDADDDDVDLTAELATLSY